MFTLTAGLIIENKTLRDEIGAVVSSLPVRVLFDEPSLGDWTALEERFARTAVEVVIIDTAAAGTIEETVSRIRGAAQRPAVIVAHTDADPGMILRVLRSGASEYLFTPVEATLKSALTRISADRERVYGGAVRSGGRCVAFLSAKGGCGATTAACHVAADIPAKTGKKVLVADCDLQSGLVSFMMKSRSGYSVADVAGNIHRLDESYWSAVISNGKPGVEVLAAPENPTSRDLDRDNLPAIIQFARSQYEWVVLDLGRSVTSTTLTLADTVQDLYLVTTTDIPALHQSKHVLRILADAGYAPDHVRVVLNRMPRRMDVSVDELEKMLGAPICITIPDDPAPLNEALAEGKLLDFSGGLGRHFSRLTSKVCGIPAEPPVRKLLGFF